MNLVSPEDFERNLRDSGLFADGELRQFTTASAEDGHAIARSLVAAEKITAYQADAILHRRFENLRIGNYEVLAKLGEGGMGAVFKARHRKMKRIVALKLLAPAIASQGAFVQRFQREVETIAQLSHPNIVMAFDADECEAGHFLIMEFVNGRDLASEVQNGGPLSVAEAVDCVRQSAEGLAYAHRQDIIHRDIKPANLLRDAGGLVKVADLGLARLSHGGETTSLTQAGGIVGTADYMPPEQALDSTTLDGRADVYSLGCTLFFLLAGRPPFLAGSLMALLLQHRDAEIPSLTALRPDVPRSLEAVCRRMLAKKAADRYQTMEQVIKALDGLSSEVQPLTIRPGTPKSSAAVASSITDMTVTIESSPVSQGPSSSAVHRISDLVIVIAEPSRVQASIVRKMLEDLTITNVYIGTTGEVALSLAREHQPHVILSAMHLREMTGIVLVHTLRSRSDTTGFILMSSEDDLSEHAEMLATLHGHVLHKPFDAQTLAQVLARATGRSADQLSNR